MVTERLPHATHIEQNIIGAILLDHNVLHAAAEIITPEMFYHDRYRTIYISMLEVDADGLTCDLASLGEHLRGQQEPSGGWISEMASCVQVTGTSAAIESHCHILADKYRSREVWKALTSLQQNSLSHHFDADKELEIAQNALIRLQVSGDRHRQSVGEVISEIIDGFDASTDHIALSTGFPFLDGKLGGGLRKKELSIVAAPPSMGKTSLAISMIDYAVSSGHRVAFFSLEMSIRSVAMRLLSIGSGVSFRDIQSAKPNPSELDKIIRSAKRLSESKLHIDDTAGTTPATVRARCKHVITTEGPLDLVVVDYLGLMTTNRHMESREREVAEISRSLKAIAKDLDCPVVALSQLSRKYTQRADAKPHLSDLRDSGSIEADADIVMFIHREDYAGTGGGGESGPAELLIRKNRNGECGSVRMYFDAPTMRFIDK